MYLCPYAAVKSDDSKTPNGIPKTNGNKAVTYIGIKSNSQKVTIRAPKAKAYQKVDSDASSLGASNTAVAKTNKAIAIIHCFRFNFSILNKKSVHQRWTL